MEGSNTRRPQSSRCRTFLRDEFPEVGRTPGSDAPEAPVFMLCALPLFCVARFGAVRCVLLCCVVPCVVSCCALCRAVRCVVSCLLLCRALCLPCFVLFCSVLSCFAVPRIVLCRVFSCLSFPLCFSMAEDEHASALPHAFGRRCPTHVQPQVSLLGLVRPSVVPAKVLPSGTVSDDVASQTQSVQDLVWSVHLAWSPRSR